MPAVGPSLPAVKDPAGTLLVIGLIRLLDLVIPGGVWLPYLLLGVVVTGLGALLFRKRNEPVVGRTSAR